MAFTVRNANFAKGEAIFTQDLEILAMVAQGCGVMTGGAITAQGSPDMSVHGEAGTAVVYQGVLTVAAADYPITAADAGAPRMDLISVDLDGTVEVTDGIPNANPDPPLIPIHEDRPNVVLAMVYVRAGTTAILAGDLIDKRAMLGSRRAVGADGDGATPTFRAIGLGPRLDLQCTRGPLAARTDVAVDDPVAVIRAQAVTGGGFATTLNLVDAVKVVSPLRTLTTIELTELSLVQSWNDAAHLFTGLALDADLTAALAGSLFVQLSLSGVTKVTIDTAGNLVLTGGIKCVLPTSAGTTGTLWNDSGTVKVS